MPPQNNKLGIDAAWLIKFTEASAHEAALALWRTAASVPSRPPTAFFSPGNMRRASYDAYFSRCCYRWLPPEPGAVRFFRKSRG